ncbi:hypothetical protein BIW11_04637 [Tropilaelaps mercedesae]|uniref:Uncharacterized protein n=1 Tax=Tropilaelaps mercedesae TaxID=418985 RepID=A0A1V9X3S9_9ACAR|nr:hypothetical protein BIW11_04637 [Tropilaelaps mercedesae]
MRFIYLSPLLLQMALLGVLPHLEETTEG